jgi:hypothetical protein
MVTILHLGDLGKGPHPHHGGGGRRGWGWGGGWPGYYDYGAYYEAPENRYVIIDNMGRPVAVVKGTPQVPPGYTFRLATPAEAATGIPQQQAPLVAPAPIPISPVSGIGFHSPMMQRYAAGGAPQSSFIYAHDGPPKKKRVKKAAAAVHGFGDYVVRGPEGELYGRYKTYPTPAQIPIYSMVEAEGMSGIF